MLQKKRNLDAKIPEIRKTLEMVQFLQTEAEEGDDSKEIETLYELNDTLFATANIKPTGKVCLWLGVSLYSTTPFQFRYGCRTVHVCAEYCYRNKYTNKHLLFYYYDTLG